MPGRCSGHGSSERPVRGTQFYPPFPPCEGAMGGNAGKRAPDPDRSCRFSAFGVSGQEPTRWMKRCSVARDGRRFSGGASWRRCEPSSGPSSGLPATFFPQQMPRLKCGYIAGRRTALPRLMTAPRGSRWPAAFSRLLVPLVCHHLDGLHHSPACHSTD
jgi:hypothetical protein